MSRDVLSGMVMNVSILTGLQWRIKLATLEYFSMLGWTNYNRLNVA